MQAGLRLDIVLGWVILHAPTRKEGLGFEEYILLHLGGVLRCYYEPLDIAKCYYPLL
jgi:hypothetical protein